MSACVWIIDNQLRLRDLTLYERGELLIARAKFSQLKEQAKENQAAYSGNQYEVGLFVNSQKVQTPVNTTKELATELKTSEQTASRIIQLQAKAKDGRRKSTYEVWVKFDPDLNRYNKRYNRTSRTK